MSASGADGKRRILIVEDDEGVASFVRLELEHEGYETETASDGRSALELFGQGSFDLILLDIMLPQLNGIEVLRRIRRSSEVPVIVVTARADTETAVTALDTGADDYIAKPFAIEELLARIRRMFRRAPQGSGCGAGGAISLRGIEIDAAACRVARGGVEVPLTRTEFALLLCLASNRGKAMTRDEIIDFVWGKDHFIEAASVDVYVRYLRAKLDVAGEESIIKTLRGIGYIIPAG